MITDSFDIATETYINEEDFMEKKERWWIHASLSFQIRSIRKY